MSVVLGRLYALREQLDAVIELLEVPEPAVCEHPVDKRKYRGETMGESDAYTCGQCGTAVESPESIVRRIVRQ